MSPDTKKAHYQHQADYYGERAREAGARYLETGDRLDLIWFRHFIAVHLRYVGRVLA